VSTEQQSGPIPAPPPHTIKQTRNNRLWIAMAVFGVILVLLLIFILENGRTVDIAYLGAHGHLPLGVALLFAAICGVLLGIFVGAARVSRRRRS
jgi:uncharacterized integral membrane protein